MLTSSGLCDHAFLAHSQAEQGLSQRVVDLVSAGVVHVLALEIDLRSADLLGQAFAEVQLAGPSADLAVASRQLGGEALVGHRAGELGIELLQSGYERFGDEPPAELPEISLA